MRPVLRRLLNDRAGATAIEYGLIVALVALAALGAIKLVADQNTGIWGKVATQVTSHA